MILETARLKLREITLQDARRFHEFFSDEETMRFYPSTRNYQETEEFVHRQLKRYEMDGFGPWALLLKPEDAVIGYCGLIHQIVEDRDEIEIGYLVSRDHWRKGFAAEAAIACRNYGFEVMRLPRLISLIDPLNVASIGVSKKVGMTLEKQSVWQGKLMNVYSISNAQRATSRNARIQDPKEGF